MDEVFSADLLILRVRVEPDLSAMNYCDVCSRSLTLFVLLVGENLNTEGKVRPDLDVTNEVDFPRYLQISFFRLFLFPALFRRIALRFLLLAFDFTYFLLHRGLALKPFPAAQLCIW